MFDFNKTKVGDLVAYEDQANPRRIYRVTRVGFREFELVETGRSGQVIWSDLRQPGWTRVVTRPAGDELDREAWALAHDGLL